MTCGVCLEACPEREYPFQLHGSRSSICQVRLFNSHPTGAMNKDERLEALMGDGGIAGMRKLPKLRAGLSEGNPADHIDRCDEQGGHPVYVPQMAFQLI